MRSISIFIVALTVLVAWILAQPPKDEQTETVFVYGTLTDPIVRAYACWCIRDDTSAVLDGYYKKGRDVVASSTASVTGELITVTPEELARLDRYERVPEKYERIQITVGGEDVWLYDKR